MRRLLLSVLTVGALVGLMAAAKFAALPEKPLLADGVWLGSVHPRLSPDGKSVAVSYLGAVWTVPRAGGVMTRLTHGEGFDIEPVWSPDGGRIAYVNSPRFGSGELQIVTADGKNVPLKKRVEVLGTVLYQKLEWLADDRLVGVLRVDGQSLGFGWINLSTGETKTLAQTTTWGRFAASPDGQWLVYTTTQDQPGQQGGNDGTSVDVWRVSLNGGEPEKLFRFPSRIEST